MPSIFSPNSTPSLMHCSNNSKAVLSTDHGGADLRSRQRVTESLGEHLAIKRVLADIMTVDLYTDQIAVKLSVLKEQVLHHAHEDEEAQLFPMLRTSMTAGNAPHAVRLQHRNRGCDEASPAGRPLTRTCSIDCSVVSKLHCSSAALHLATVAFSTHTSELPIAGVRFCLDD